MGLQASANVVVWAGLSNSQSIGYSYTTISKRLKITTLKVYLKKLGIGPGLYGKSVLYLNYSLNHQKCHIWLHLVFFHFHLGLYLYFSYDYIFDKKLEGLSLLFLKKRNERFRYLCEGSSAEKAIKYRQIPGSANAYKLLK